MSRSILAAACALLSASAPRVAFVFALLAATSSGGCSAEAVPGDSEGLSAGAATDENRTVDPLLHAAVTEKRFPGAVVHAGVIMDPSRPEDDQTFTRAYGTMAYDTRLVTEETRYDLASVTKVLGTTTAVMREVDKGRLRLDAKVRDVLPELSPAYATMTVKSLLSHTSCLADGPPPGSLADLKGRGADATKVVAFMNLHAARIFLGACSPTYSDLNMVLAGAVVQKTSGKRLDVYLRDEVFAPLGMTKTGFNPSASEKPSVAPTEVYVAADRAGRRGAIVGEVHDETSFYFGGVGGNAGLFSTAGDVGKLIRALLTDRIVGRTTRDLFFASQGVRDQLGATRALGWEIAPAHCGKGFGPRTVGHTGFAGTSVCIDPDQGVYTVVLTNRVFPSRLGKSIHPDRVALSAALVDKVSPCVLRPRWTVCGNTQQGGFSGKSGILYACAANGNRATVCPRGCVSAPAGTADHCGP